MNSKKQVFIFTEASKTIGYGHLVRCFSLYDECVEKGTACKIYYVGKVHSFEMFQNREVECLDWHKVENLYAIDLTESYCVIDSYLASQEVYEYISKTAIKVMFIDDFHRLDYPEGIVWSPLLTPLESYQTLGNKNKVCSGSQSILLRKEFQERFEPKRANIVKNVLLILGGTDGSGVRESITTCLSQKNKEIHFHIVVGNNEEQHQTVENITYYTNLSAKELVRLMRKVDFIISAMGQTMFELLSLNVPFLPIQIADNQENNKKDLLHYFPEVVVYDARAGVNSERLEDCFLQSISKDYQEQFIQHLSNLVDGQGVKRSIEGLVQ